MDELASAVCSGRDQSMQMTPDLSSLVLDYLICNLYWMYLGPLIPLFLSQFEFLFSLKEKTQNRTEINNHLD
jgi:hypothetical protein